MGIGEVDSKDGLAAAVVPCIGGETGEQLSKKLVRAARLKIVRVRECMAIPFLSTNSVIDDTS